MAYTDRSLIVRTVESAPAHREEFEAWQDRFAYDTLQLDGVHSARRFTKTSDPNSWITCHDIDSEKADEILAAERERLATEQDSQSIIGLATQWDHQLYRGMQVPQFTNSDDPDVVGGIANFVWWTPRPGTESDLEAWYDEEHLPLLMGIPGWLRIRRFELAGEGGLRFLAIHDIRSPQVFGHPLQRKARTTPWRARVIADRLQYTSTGYTLSRVL